MRLLMCFSFLIAGCASVSKLDYTKNTKELYELNRKGSIQEIEAYFSENASIYPDGLAAGSTEAVLKFGSDDNRMTFEAYKKTFNAANDLMGRIKNSCTSKESAVRSLKCMAERNSFCQFDMPQNYCTIKVSKVEKGLQILTVENIDKFYGPSEYLTSDNYNWYRSTITDLVDKANQELKTEIDSPKPQAESVYSNAIAEQCTTFHDMKEISGSDLESWGKKIGLNREQTLDAFKNFQPYASYEGARQRGTVVLKPMGKPNISLVQIMPLSLDKSKMAHNEKERKALATLSPVYYIAQFGTTPIFFAEYKRVPCGMVAMKFNKVVFQDYGVVIYGATFQPSK